MKKCKNFPSITGILFIAAFFSISLSAKEEKKSSEKAIPTKELMNEFLGQLTALKKYFVSEAVFLDQKNSSEIGTRLKQFVDLTKKAAHDPVLNQENFKFSRSVLEEHITDTERVFRLGNKSYARWQLASTVSVCMSCHTQLPSSSRSFSDFANAKIFSSSFDQAEFLFATRSFDQAFSLYGTVIDDFPKNKASIEQVETALKRQLAYLSRIRRDPLEGEKVMKKHLKNSDLPAGLRQDISNWIVQFEKWKKKPTPSVKEMTDEKIVLFAKKALEDRKGKPVLESSNPQLVTQLQVSGILFEFLQAHPQSQVTAQILYWLALCERSVDPQFFYSLSHLYLRECVLRFPADPVAKKCLKEYEDETVFGYTGSSGTHLPLEVREELDSMKKWIESEGKLSVPSH